MGDHRRDSILSRINFIELGYVRLSGHFTTYVLYSVHTLHGTRGVGAHGRDRRVYIHRSGFMHVHATCQPRFNPHGWGQSSDH